MYIAHILTILTVNMDYNLYAQTCNCWRNTSLKDYNVTHNLVPHQVGLIT